MGLGAGAAIFPAVVEEPSVWSVAPVGSDDAHGVAGDFFYGFVKAAGLLASQGLDAAAGADLGAPENFVGHPVADAGADFLVEQEGFHIGSLTFGQMCLKIGV